MGRGAQAQTQQLTDQQLAGINALNQQLLGNQQQLGNLLVPQFQSIANNPGNRLTEGLITDIMLTTRYAAIRNPQPATALVVDNPGRSALRCSLRL